MATGFKRHGFPNLPPGLDPNMRKWFEHAQETIEIADGLRSKQDPLDQKPSYRDLVDAGLLEVLSGSKVLLPGQTVVPTNPPGDQTIPPAPTGFTANGGLDHIFLEWDKPLSLYSNHSFTSIYRHDSDNLANAVEIAQIAIGSLYADFDVNHGQTYYYWIRFVSTSNITGPPNSSTGTAATVSEDPAYLLDVLSGQITETQLFADLNDRIDLIDTPTTGLVDRVTVTETETSANASAITTLTSTVGDNTASIQTNATSIDGIHAQYTVKIDVNGAVAGYGLSVTQPDYDGGVAHSDMVFVVDTFSIFSPGATSLSFAVDSGQVVMDAAFIVNLVVNDADIGNVNITSIQGVTSSFILSTIGTGNITNAYIGDFIQSDNFVSGSTGWRIDKSGTAEFPTLLANYIQTTDIDVIGTLMIQGNAVTIPTAAFSSSAIAVDSHTTATLLQSVSFVPTGNNPVHLNCSCVVRSGGGGPFGIRFRVVRQVGGTGGSLDTIYNFSSGHGGNTIFADREEVIALNLVDNNPGSIITEYFFQAFRFPDTNTGLTAANRNILAVEFKR